MGASSMGQPLIPFEAHIYFKLTSTVGQNAPQHRSFIVCTGCEVGQYRAYPMVKSSSQAQVVVVFKGPATLLPSQPRKNQNAKRFST